MIWPNVPISGTLLLRVFCEKRGNWATIKLMLAGRPTG